MCNLQQFCHTQNTHTSFFSSPAAAQLATPPPWLYVHALLPGGADNLGNPEYALPGLGKGEGRAAGAEATLQGVLVQVATPTREAVEHYQDERQEIERLVGEINGRFGRIGLPVIHYLYQTLGFDELIALYRAGDVMLVTPFRDGINLVAKEYAAAHIDGDGVLVLSEFAGAADELTDAVLVNPHDEQALQQAIITAVEMHRH